MDWFPDWTGQRCAIVASGPSAVEQPIDMLRGRARVIVVNNSWRLAPWADALYASDAGWWRQHGGVPQFNGLKISRSAEVAAEFPDVRIVSLKPGTALHPWCNEILLDQRGVIGAGGSSGFQALNMAVQFGATDIALVGFDARVDLGLHWHQDHARPLNNPTAGIAAQWVRHLDDAALLLATSGIRVVNCSPVSALTAYEKMELEEWLGSK